LGALAGSVAVAAVSLGELSAEATVAFVS